jgi:hypothetical protein
LFNDEMARWPMYSVDTFAAASSKELWKVFLWPHSTEGERASTRSHEEGAFFAFGV